MALHASPDAAIAALGNRVPGEFKIRVYVPSKEVLPRQKILATLNTAGAIGATNTIPATVAVRAADAFAKMADAVKASFAPLAGAIAGLLGLGIMFRAFFRPPKQA